MVWVGSKLADLPESDGNSGVMARVSEDFRAEFEIVCANLVLINWALLNQP